MASDLRTQLAPLDAEALRTGVPYLPEWLEWSDWAECWWDNTTNRPLTDAAARMIAEAGMGRMLAERGVKVYRYANIWHIELGLIGEWPHSTDYFTALLAATARVYATLLDKTAEKGEGQ